MAGYGWDEYDVRDGGRQTIHDAGNNIDITTEFVKIAGGLHGGNWGLRIKGTPREDAPPHLMSTVIFYTAMEGLGSLEIANEKDPLGIQGTVTIKGQTAELGEFTIDITEGPESNMHPPASHQSSQDKPLDRTLVASFQVPEDAIWQTKRMSRTFNAGRSWFKKEWTWLTSWFEKSSSLHSYEGRDRRLC